MARLERANHPGMDGYIFTCPGCGMDHMIVTRYTPEYRKSRRDAGWGCPEWEFNGDLNLPTFKPSLLVRYPRGLTDAEHARVMAGEKIETDPQVCHSFITSGQIQFLGDCTHALKNQTVDLPEVKTDGQ